MTDVACYCGCCYSFDGGAGACPKCGEYATVTAGPAFASTGRSQQEQPGPATNGAAQNGQTAGTRRERAETGAGSLARLAIIAIARGPGTGQEDRR